MGIENLSGLKNLLDSLTPEMKKQLLDGNFKIFENNEEIKSHIAQMLGVNSIEDINISDILSINYKDGEVINQDDEEFYAMLSKELEESENKPQADNEANDTEVSNINENSDKSGKVDAKNNNGNDDKVDEKLKQELEKLYEDERVLKLLGLKSPDEFTDEMKKNFENYLKDLDGNSELTSTDISKLYEQLSDENFKFPEDILEDSTDGAKKPEEDKKPSEAQGGSSGSPSYGISGGGGGSGSGSSTSGVSNSSNTEAPDLKTEDEKLQEAYDNAKEELSTKRQSLEELKIKNEQDLQTLQEEVDNKYNEYQDQLKEFDEKLASDIDEKNKQINDKEKEIADNDNAITDKKTSISELQTAYDGAVDRTQTLKEQLSTLTNGEQTEAVQEKILQLNTAIAQAQAAEEQAKSKLETAKQELSELETKKTTLESDLDQLNSEMQELEKKAMENPEVKEKMDAWHEAKDKLDQKKAEQKIEIDSAQSEVDAAQERVNQAQAAINEYNNKQEAKKYSVSSIDIDVDIEANLTDSQKAELEKFKQNYNEHKADYEAVAAATGVAPEAIAAIHWRESSGNFNTYLHNGDPLGKPTTHVPAGKFFTDWKDAAIDAINGEKDETFANRASNGSNTDISSTGKLSDILLFTERYNGFGMRDKHNLPSSYVWSGTTTYQGGKYVADGEFSASTYDKQLGTAIMIKALLDV